MKKYDKGFVIIGGFSSPKYCLNMYFSGLCVDILPDKGLGKWLAVKDSRKSSIILDLH